MHIVIYHDAKIPPQDYGGTERVFYWLAKGLVSLGHQVTLIAREGSQIPGVQVIPCHAKQQEDWESCIPNNADLIHLANTPQRIPKKSYLITIGGYGKVNEVFLPNTVFVSKRHAAFHGSENYVYNGIDVSEYFSDDKREDYLVFLAKAAWKVKNLKGAIAIAKKARLPLYVMGNRSWPFALHEKLQLFNDSQVRYFGMVGDVQKREILRKARALLFPVRWHEPFGLAIIEALASGCFILGTPYGSLPEIITPDIGVLSMCAEDLVQTSLHPIFSPALCRQRVQEKFSHLDMARKYIQYYEEILQKGNLKNKNPCIQIQKGFFPNTLLPWRYT